MDHIGKFIKFFHYDVITINVYLLQQPMIHLPCQSHKTLKLAEQSSLLLANVGTHATDLFNSNRTFSAFKLLNSLVVVFC